MPTIRVPAKKKTTTLTVSFLLFTLKFTVHFIFFHFCWFFTAFISHDLCCCFFFLQVAIKCRPLTERERGRNIVRVKNNKVSGKITSFSFLVLIWKCENEEFVTLKEVIVLDPDLSKDYLDRIQNRTKEKKYCFDHAFGPHCTNLVRQIFFFLIKFLFEAWCLKVL